MTADNSVSPETHDGYAKISLGKNPRQLASMSDSELATWQSKYSYGTPQWVMAEREWQRRLVVEQVKATRFSGWLSVVGSVAGSLLGFLLGYFIATSPGKETKLESPEQACRCECSKQIQTPASSPEPTRSSSAMHEAKPIDVKPSTGEATQKPP